MLKAVERSCQCPCFDREQVSNSSDVEEVKRGGNRSALYLALEPRLAA